MPQLVNPRNQGNATGFNPNVDNTQRIAMATPGGKFAWYSMWILIIPAIYHIVKRNSLIRMQTKVNELSSGIDVQLKKRRDTLIKLVDATKSYMKYEKSLLTDVTNLRNMNMKNAATADDKMTKMFGNIVAVAENYPDLKASTAVVDMMDQATYLEREIAASRRLYNAQVQEFNASLFTWPTNVISSSMHLSTLPFFEASTEDKQDVSLDLSK